MRRLVVVLAILVAVPAAIEAQPRLMGGGGFTAPTGAISDVANPGYHMRVALRVAVPTLPVGLQADGDYHKLGAANVLNLDTQVLSGALSVVFTFPGIFMQPYALGGVGSYRVKNGLVDNEVSATRTGYHGGFGVTLGGFGLGAFAEFRYVHIGGAVVTRLLPLTLGLRL